MLRKVVCSNSISTDYDTAEYCEEENLLEKSQDRPGFDPPENHLFGRVDHLSDEEIGGLSSLKSSNRSEFDESEACDLVDNRADKNAEKEKDKINCDFSVSSGLIDALEVSCQSTAGANTDEKVQFTKSDTKFDDFEATKSFSYLMEIEGNRSA